MRMTLLKRRISGCEGRFTKGRLPVRDDLGPWLHRITLNVCRDFHRERARRNRLPDLLSEGQEATADASVQREFPADLVSSLRLLTRTQRQILFMTVFEDMTLESTARHLDIPLSTAKSHMRRARLKLSRMPGDLSGGVAGFSSPHVSSPKAVA
jgi:RNA polymerase sigma factor (sigma-70 family)